VGREAWERALKPHARDRASFIPELTSQLEQSGRLMIVDGDHLPGCFADRLFFRKSFGHTPGHLHTGFRGDQQTVFFCGDLIPGRAWIHLPITMGYDRFPEMLIDEKANLYETAVRDHWLLFFTHDPEVAAAHVRRDEKGKFVPRDEIKVLNQSTI
jgi:glyoxylase-like metal-dependent hydrolase (beta-lactamase superfamily II)